MTNKWVVQVGVPVLILLAGVGLAHVLVSQDRAVKVNDQGVPVQTAPVLAPPIPGQEKAYPGRNGAPPGAVIRSLDKINAAAARVGCETIKPDDPAGRLIDIAECLGEKAMQAK